MATYDLVPHPNHPATGISKVSAEVLRLPDGSIDLDFDVDGASALDIWENPVEAAFTDGLWQGTCFEAFLTAADVGGYVELNFTPSGLWAAYSFDDYRAGMRPLPETDMEPWAFRWSRAVSVRSGACIPSLPSDLAWQINLTAIIKAKDGTKSYWALAHAPGPPDFHNPACFTATLPPPPRT